MARWRWTMWQGPLAPSLERLKLTELPDGFELDGVILQAHASKANVIRYHIEVDANWLTRAVAVELDDGGPTRSLRLARDHATGWRADGIRLDLREDIVDVDLEWSPSTNTLPIRRFGLETGASATLVAAWVRFPSLAVEPLEQSYERLDQAHYRYRSGDFRADLEVDGDGLVTTYGANWRTVSTGGWS